MNRTITLAAILAIAGCTAAQQQQAQTVIAQGQQFCAIATAPMPTPIERQRKQMASQRAVVMGPPRQNAIDT